MKNRIILHLLLITFCFSSRPIVAQEVTKKSFQNAITFNITRLALLEARFGYERNLTPRGIIRGTLGVQFPISSESFNNVSIVLSYVPFYYTVSKGIYISIGYKYILSARTKFYLSPEVYFNYNYYHDKYYKFGVGTDMDSYISLQSMQLEKSGIKLLIGKEVTVVSFKKTRVEFDFFGGMGFQFRSEQLTIYAKQSGIYSVDKFNHPQVYDPPKEENTNYWTPTYHGGILISFSF